EVQDTCLVVGNVFMPSGLDFSNSVAAADHHLSQASWRAHGCRDYILGRPVAPCSLAVLGIIPGLILIAFLGLLSSYTGYFICQYKIRYSYVHSMADAGGLLFRGHWPRALRLWSVILHRRHYGRLHF